MLCLFRTLWLWFWELFLPNNILYKVPRIRLWYQNFWLQDLSQIFSKRSLIIHTHCVMIVFLKFRNMLYLHLCCCNLYRTGQHSSFSLILVIVFNSNIQNMYVVMSLVYWIELTNDLFSQFVRVWIPMQSWWWLWCWSVL